MKGFFLGLLVAALAFGGYLFWQHQRGQAARPVVASADSSPAPATRKPKRRARGAVRVARAPAAPAAAEASEPEPEPVRLSAADSAFGGPG